MRITELINKLSDFRRELRRRAHEYESQEYERLENIFEVDNSAFQRIMSGKRKSKEIQTNALKIDGKFISDPNELCEIWKQHYSKLYTPAQSTSFDLSFTEHVESSLYEYERERVEMLALMRWTTSSLLKRSAQYALSYRMGNRLDLMV